VRLGIGIGWNPVEYEALGENFHNRGRRSEEQIEVLRKLWTQELVTFEGRWHKITDAGLNPLPIQRPIPLWFGGGADAVLERVGRLGDGWFPLGGTNEKCRGHDRCDPRHARAPAATPKASALKGESRSAKVRLRLGSTRSKRGKISANALDV
jgi:alkanesulfonate monooxygenase SsuD/methylene tetrahydromethanopterin reductase-like flavin-dependent oxidoreductase (luciferase family)